MEKQLNKEYDDFFFHNYNLGVPGASGIIRIRGNRSISQRVTALQGKVAGLQEVVVTGYGVSRRKDLTGSVTIVKSGNSITDTNAIEALDGGNKQIQNSNQQGSEVQIRKNFNETAFFFPDLHTDSTGAIEFSFTMPEALTKWKFMALAHTKDLAFGASTKEIITQKQLMVQPNAPRFLREGDRMEFSSKIVNLTDKELTGTAELQLFDATTNQPVDGAFQNMYANQYFTAAAGQSEAVKFPIQVPVSI